MRNPLEHTLPRRRAGRMPAVLQMALDENGVVSPDGKWLAFSSNESGRSEICVTPP